MSIRVYDHVDKLNIVQYSRLMNVVIFGAAGALGRVVAPAAESLAVDLMDPAGARAAASGDAVLNAPAAA